jgi:mannose-6-phosphate isomerase-like protein (cupin superfamily)
MPIARAPESFTHALPHARFTSLATPSRGSRETSLWRVRIEPGTPGAPHQVTREELFVVLAGRARVRIGGELAEAGAGDSIIVPRDTDFAIESAGDEPLEALCCLPVGGQARLPSGQPFTPPWAE